VEVVAEVGDGESAVQAVAENRPSIAIIDVSMPGLDGVAATERILQLNLGTKVIGLSGHTERSYIARMLRAGASGYVLKSAAARELRAAIDAVLRGETYLSPKAAESLRSADPAPDPSVLTEREITVLRMLAAGSSSKEIGEALFLSHRTVESHRTRIMDKLGIRTVAGLTQYSMRHGLIDHDHSVQ
jgi:DNA-binding NarL/FixJ family response regulator